MKRYSIFFMAFLLLLSMQGCITSDYDLSKTLDGTVCFTPGGFTLGGDNSADVPLDDIIELKDSGQLTTDSVGNYLFYKKGRNIEPAIVNVGQGSICDAYEMTQAVDFSSANVESLSRYPGYANMTLGENIRLNAHPDHQGENVRELLYITTGMSIVIQTSFTGNISNFCNSMAVTYQLPSFYIPADESELTETIKMSEFDKTHEHIIHLKGVDFTKNGQKAGERIAVLHPSGDLVIEGSINVQAKAIINTAKYETELKSNPKMNVNIVVGTMGTTQVTGRFDEYKKVDIEPIVFNDVPDFIKDAEVIVDLDNPIVRVRLDNEVPADVMLNATMKGYKDNAFISQVNAGNEYGTEPIVFLGATEQEPVRSTNVWLSKRAVQIPDTVESNVVIPNMNDLIRTVPDRVDIDAAARTDSSQVVTVALGRDYKATPTYELYAPLQTGSNMKIVYTKDITDLHDHLKDMELDGITFTGDVKNNMPLDLHLSVTPLDSSDKVVEGVAINTTDIVPANGTKSVTFTMTNANAKAVQNIYKIRIKAYAESSETIAGQYLNKSQDLQVSHAKITLIGAKYNLN